MIPGRKFLTLLFLFVCASIYGAVPERPMPIDNSLGAGGHPRLSWNLPGDNLLTNGGFEQGDAGWVLVGTVSFKAGILTNSAQTFEGTNVALAIALRTTVTLPIIRDRFIWSFATSTRIDGIAVEVLTNDPGSKSGFSVAKRADFSQVVSFNSAWNVYSLDISEFSGEAVTLQLRSLVEAGTSPIFIDDVRVTVEPSDVEFNVSLNGVTLGQTRTIGGSSRTCSKIKNTPGKSMPSKTARPTPVRCGISQLPMRGRPIKFGSPIHRLSFVQMSR
jgi:hypothetical protein